MFRATRRGGDDERTPILSRFRTRQHTQRGNGSDDDDGASTRTMSMTMKSYAIRFSVIAAVATVGVLCTVNVFHVGRVGTGGLWGVEQRFETAARGSATTEETNDEPAHLGLSLSELENKAKEFTNLFNAGKAPFKQATDSFNNLAWWVRSGLLTNVNSMKQDITGFPDWIGESVGDLVEGVFKKLFITDAGDFVNSIATKFSSSAAADLGSAGDVSASFEERSAMGSIVRKLNQDVLREQLRAKLYPNYTPKLGSAYEKAATLGCSSLSADTSAHEAAKLGCVPISSLTKVCYEAPMRDLLPETAFELEYSMPWPEKLSDSPFAPMEFKVGFPTAEWETCAGIEKFVIPTEVATKLIAAFRLFFGALFDAITDGARDAAVQAANSMMVPINAIEGQINVAKGHVDTAANSVSRVTNIFNGRRRLLSTTESENLHAKLKTHSESIATLAAHADLTYQAAIKRIENDVLFKIEKIRQILIKDPLLEDPKSFEFFPDYNKHFAARLGGGPASEKLSSCREALIGAMQALKNTEFEAAITSNLEVAVKAELSASAFMSGDFMDSIASKMKKPVQNPYMLSKTQMLGYGFYVNMAFGIGFKLPYFAKAEGHAELGYTLKVPNMKLGVKSENGQFNVLFNPPKPAIERDGESASVSAHLQIGAELEIPIVQIELCWAGAICAGPKMYFAQGAQVGLDAFAAAMGAPPADCFPGETTLAAGFSDFEYPGKSSKCTLSGSGFAAGFGAYYQIPKPDASVILTTTISQPCTVDVPDLVLFSSSKEDGFYTQGAVFDPVCASSITGSTPPPQQCA
jgi:hypothetical protein